jgi:hypothetical protein
MVATYLAETSPYLTLGNSQTGIALSYGSCMPASPFLILTIQYLVQGATPPGCEYWVVPDPTTEYDNVMVVDCDSVLRESYGGVAYINGFPGLCTVGVEETTWGKVKSLYR